MSKKSSKDKPIDTEMIRQFMLGGIDHKDSSSSFKKKPAATVDLHLDETSSDYDMLSDNEKLDFQLKHLDKQISRAITGGAHSIEVIHGKGEGKLKDAVQAFLKKHPSVKSFHVLTDRRHDSGATEVFFK